LVNQLNGQVKLDVVDKDGKILRVLFQDQKFDAEGQAKIKITSCRGVRVQKK
jgi:hypothetical protein